MVKGERSHYIIHILDILLHITFTLKDFSQARKKSTLYYIHMIGFVHSTSFSSSLQYAAMTTPTLIFIN